MFGVGEASDVNRPAPGELWRIQHLVNTADLELGTDELSSPAGAVAWLREVGLAEDMDAAGLARLVRFREALRQLLIAHNGGALPSETLDELAAVAGSVALSVRFGADGAPRVRAAGSGADAVIGRLLAIVARAEADGTWERLKACPADDCHWAFYDFSRNRSRTWCDMQVCGNRAKARSYRARQGG
jgi:predicted RNA-binding Zn ribbon-like protein